jgi:hypothetical protein
LGTRPAQCIGRHAGMSRANHASRPTPSGYGGSRTRRKAARQSDSRWPAWILHECARLAGGELTARSAAGIHRRLRKLRPGAVTSITSDTLPVRGLLAPAAHAADPSTGRVLPLRSHPQIWGWSTVSTGASGIRGTDFETCRRMRYARHSITGSFPGIGDPCRVALPRHSERQRNVATREV